MYYNRQSRLLFLILIFIVMFFGCAIKLFNLQVVNGEELRKVSEDKLYMSMSIKAPRGDIVDRYGKKFATNKTGYSLQIEKTSATKKEFAEMVFNLIKLLEKEIEFTDQLPVTYDKPFKFTIDRNSEKEWKKKYGLDVNLTAEETVLKLADIYEVSEYYTNEEKRRVCGLIFDMRLRGFSIYNPYTIAEDVSANVVAVVKENSDLLNGAKIVESSVRVYPNGTLAAHTLGSVGVIYQEEYEKLKDKNYSMDAIIGKQGVELAFEDYLKGTDGIKGFEQTIDGLSDVVTSMPAEKGDNVYLTIDYRVQNAMEKSLEQTIKNIQQSVSDCNAGSAVCIDVNSGEILGIASYPSYVPSEYNKKYNELIKNPANPVWNRAIGGAYEPGSTFKMVTGIGALEEGIIGPYDTILDEGVYKYYNDYRPQCMEWKYGKTHGYVDIAKALEKSCNYYFFDVGRLLGIEKLIEYERKFGFGEKTGIEIGGEVSGVIASPEYRKKMGGTWNPGDILQASIGQSDNLITPIQLANYVATIANGGTLYQPHLLKYVKDSETGDIIKEQKPVVKSEIKLKTETVDAIKRGMRRVADEGTASSVFSDFFIEVAGKTGTAEVSRGSNNGIFVAFAPYDNPQIAIAVVIEHGTGGYLAAPVAKAVFEEYFGEKVIDDLYEVKKLK